MLGTVNNGGETAVLFAESLGQNLDEFWRTNAPIILQVTKCGLPNYLKKIVIFSKFV